MYTSGSTGLPGRGSLLGIMRSPISWIAWHRNPGLSPDDRFLAMTTLTFDTALAELLAPLVVAATVLVGSDLVGLDGA